MKKLVYSKNVKYIFTFFIALGYVDCKIIAQQNISFTLTSDSTQTMTPFTTGLVFKKGDIKGFPKLTIPDQQVIIKRRWNDGSVKHAIASGHISLSANVSKTVYVHDSLAASGGVNLTATSIQAANPVASVQLGSFGTVNLSSLLATPTRVWISGPEMVEAHYHSKVGTDASLSVWFQVRLYKSGHIWIRSIVENGNLDILNTPEKRCNPIVTIGGTMIYNNAGDTLITYGNTRWTAEGWIDGNISVIAAQNTSYLNSTKLVPNYWKRNPSEASLNALPQKYTPMTGGSWEPNMGSAGYSPQIGLLPLWDALYITTGDKRAYNAVVLNAKALNSYPIIWSDGNTNLPVRPSDRSSWTVYGPSAGGTDDLGAGSLVWEIAHHGSGGYLAYMITGDYYFLETMEYQSSVCYLANSSSHGSGTNRHMGSQTRASAWALRTLSQLAGIAPDGDVICADYSNLLAGNIDFLQAQPQKINGTGIGYLYEYNIDLYAPGTIAPWQQHFFIQSIGMGSDLEPLVDMTKYNSVRDYLYRAAVGILGDSTNYCFTMAYAYNIKISNGGNYDPASWYQDWKTVYDATFGGSVSGCSNTLQGGSGGSPLYACTGYWGNLLPAISYAVDHQAPGASAAWARLTGSTNWGVIESSGFDDTPIWGIVPRQNVMISVPTITAQQPEIKIYPNPSNGVFNIDLSDLKNKDTELAVYNIMGQCISKELVNGIPYQLDLSQHAEGMYILKVNNGIEKKNYSIAVVK
jgi:hypothetical protein